MRVPAITQGAVLALLLAAAQPAAAQQGAGRAPMAPRLGTASAPMAAPAAITSANPRVHPATTLASAQFGVGGIALRNRGAGTIAVSDVVTPVKAAYLYWAAISRGPAPGADRSVTLTRLAPTASSGHLITGTVVGTGAQPCWAGDTITIFRARIATTLVNGNGLYQVTLQAGAAGRTDGSDPWAAAPVLPLVDGASLVVVGTGFYNVSLFDGGLAGTTFTSNPGLGYTLVLPAASSGSSMIFANIGADGQSGSGLAGSAAVSDEVTTVNGTVVAGPGAPTTGAVTSTTANSDWNGSAGLPLPQLWDTTSYALGAAAPVGTQMLNVRIGNSGAAEYDCLTPIANVVAAN